MSESTDKIMETVYKILLFLFKGLKNKYLHSYFVATNYTNHGFFV
jgi:hypothetical protein